MNHSIFRNIGTAFLVVGLTFAVPAYANKHDGAKPMGMGEKGELGTKQLSGVMNEMSTEMKNMSGMMGKGDMNPDARKKMSSQMKEMGGMMNDMSGMLSKDMAMDAGAQKKIGEMSKQMDHMRKDMAASAAKK